MIYLASPYSHPDKKVQEQRYNAVRQTAGKMIERGLIVFSPIVHGHNLEIVADHEFWMKYCIGLLSKADELWVLYMNGTETSKGVAQEIEWWEANRDKDAIAFVAANAW